MNVDSVKLKAVLSESPSYKVVAEHFADRTRNRKSINLYRLYKSVSEKRPEVKKEDIERFFGRLEALGIGKIKSHGPNGRLKDFNLSISMAQLVKTLLNRDLKKETRVRVSRKPIEPLPETVNRFALRINRKGEIEITNPSKLSDEEIVKIAKLVASLKKD